MSNSNGENVVGGEPPAGFPLDIRAHGLELTPAMRQYARDHLGARLAKFAEHIQAVVVRFEDANGSKGGVDKVCRVEVLLAHEEPLVIEETEEDVRAAIDLVADRIEKTVQRDLERRRGKPRQRGRKLVRNAKIIH